MNICKHCGEQFTPGPGIKPGAKEYDFCAPDCFESKMEEYGVAERVRHLVSDNVKLLKQVKDLEESRDSTAELMKNSERAPVKKEQSTHEKPTTHGGHFYPSTDGTDDCAHGCGCWAGRTRSGGPAGVDPLGECPKNPLI